MTEFTTKDSGERTQFSSGMVRDTSTGKARFDLLLPKGVPYEDQFLTRWAELMGRGAAHYSERNWEKAAGQEEWDRFAESALRHLIKYISGEDDEDNLAATAFNIAGMHYVEWRMGLIG